MRFQRVYRIGEAGYELVSGAGAPAFAHPNVDAGVSIQSS